MSRHSALNQRINPHPSRSHVNDTLTALQGATSAFNANPHSHSRPGSVRRSSNKAMEAALLAGRNVSHHAPESADHSNADSSLAPEVGSVRDKIGRFAANSRATSPQGLTDRPRSAAGVSRARTPQNIAARLATEQSPVRSEKPSVIAGSNNIALQASKKVQPSINNNHSNDARRIPVLPAPRPIRTTPDPNTFENILQHAQPSSPKDSPIYRKPIIQDTAKPPVNQAQLAAKHASPISPIQRKPPPTSGLASLQKNGNNGSNNGRSSSPHSSVYSKQLISPPSDEQKPKLPPRRGDVSVSRMESRNYGSFDGDDSPKPPLTPSIASIYTRSQNNSSSSVLGEPSLMDEEALSNAIVASSLASSRVSPAKKAAPPPPPQRRARSRSILQLAHNAKKELSRTRTPSPSRGLRQTLRNPIKAEEEEDRDRSHKMHLIHKHPHKHHEGDRRRWRSEVSENERKRYEGVWAANKGLLIPTQGQLSLLGRHSGEKYPPDASEMVVNLVVRDIWSRSRLPPAILEQIWELVDRRGIGLLARDEFVVGMWLIDQQLKGHKLPVKVADSVWNSVRRISGIKPPSLI